MRGFWLLATIIVATAPLAAQEVLKFEAEDWTTPQEAWQKDKFSEDKWNLWSTDKDAEKKWSGGVVLQSPRVLADREGPEDGAPPLHTHITGIPKGTYMVEVLGVGRAMAISFDGQEWKKIDGSSGNLGSFEIKDGTFDLWVDDRYVHQANPGSCYYDALVLTPVIAAENGIVNGDMEKVGKQLPAGWTFWSRTKEGAAEAAEDVKHSGRRSVKVSYPGERDWALTNFGRLQVKPREKYTVSAWVKSEEAGMVELAIVAYHGSELLRWNIGSDYTQGRHDWKRLEGTAWIPRDCDQIQVRLTGQGKTVIWVDDVALRKGGRRMKPKPLVAGYATERVRERLGRGVVAVPTAGGKVYVGWRLLASDPRDVAFNVYRRTGKAEPRRLNQKPITRTTDFVDEKPLRGEEQEYFVRALTGGKEGRPSEVARATPSAEGQPYLSLKLNGEHTFQKCGIADLDGDGRYDFVLKQPNANIDPYIKYWKPSPETYKVEAYKSDGTFLWRRDLGWAIERGIWYSPMVVYDLDGDGKAEVALKTGEGDPRDEDGRVTSGPEYLSIWDGLTGEERARVDWPSREGFPSYNYASRNQLCVAYLDGQTPCLIVERGTYNTIKVVAYEFQGGKLRELWRWEDREDGGLFRGQGAHSMHAVDVDGDGRDEVFLGSAVLDDNGMGLWSTGMGHPDHHYVGDIDPARPGLEVYYGMETRQREHGCCLADAKTGEIIWGIKEPTKHVHASGMCADIDPAHPGMECYSGERDLPKRWFHAANGELISTENLFGLGVRTVYWDADPQRELLRGGKIRDYGGGEHGPQIEGSVVGFADILGDWREELIVTVPGELRIYTTTIPAADRRVCLMQDPLYRMDVVIQAMGYTQCPMTSQCFSASAPSVGLNLPGRSLSARGPTKGEVLAAASLREPLRGRLRLTAGDWASIEPAEAEIEVAAGEVRRVPFELSLLRRPAVPAGRLQVPVKVRLEGAGGILEAEVMLSTEDVPLEGVPLIQAEAFSRQGGGEVHLRDDKVGASEKCFSHWDTEGHWLEWQAEVPKTGRYWLVVRYCAQKNVRRKVEVDGRIPAEIGSFEFAATGGFSSSMNDWAHAPLRGRDGAPLSLELSAGKHTLRFTNLDGTGMNVDYLALVPAS